MTLTVLSFCSSGTRLQPVDTICGNLLEQHLNRIFTRISMGLPWLGRVMCWWWGRQATPSRAITMGQVHTQHTHTAHTQHTYTHTAHTHSTFPHTDPDTHIHTAHAQHTHSTQHTHFYPHAHLLIFPVTVHLLVILFFITYCDILSFIPCTFSFL
jgi:hypothetical protein